MAPDNNIQNVNWKSSKPVAGLSENNLSAIHSEPVSSRNGVGSVYGDEELQAPESPRPRKITAPSFLDNVFNAPTGEPSLQTPRLALHECEDAEPIDIDGRSRSRYGSQSAGNNALPLLTPSESGWSEWSFASIATINDRGNEAHWEWEQSLSRNGAVEEASRHPRVPVASMISNDSVTGMNPTNQNVKTLERIGIDRGLLNDSINTESICNKLCGAFVESAFDDKSYLPLDQLCGILDPGVVRKILLEYFDEKKTSHLERAVLGVRPSEPEKQSVPPLRRKIFAILILIQEVRKLETFVEQGISDKNLPFDFKSNKSEQGTTVSYSTHDRDSPLRFFAIWSHKLARDFALYQQIVHVPFFRLPGDEVAFYDLDHGSTLPFCHYEAPKTGGYGSVRRAGVHHAHHNLSDKSHPPIPKNFAVKRLHVPDGDDFHKEVALFDKLGVEKKRALPSHLLPLQLTYRHGRDFFLMFPWADGNLKEFWEQNQADSNNHDQVRWLLEQCYGIARGLRRIHHLTTRSKEPFDASNAKSIVLAPELGGKEWGRHGDIKPENILWFKEYDGYDDHLVISDFGLTRFHSAHSRSKVLQDQIQGYSGTYQAPDLHLNAPINSRYDVWSLGCVLLEFVSWFLLGSEQGIEEFLRHRLNDPSEGPIFRSDKFFSTIEDSGSLQGEKSAEVKESVVLWIEKLHGIQSVEPLHALLDLIESTMLQPYSQARSDSDYIRDELRTLYNATKNLDPGEKGVRRGRNPDLYAHEPKETSGDYYLASAIASGTKKRQRHNSSFSQHQRPFIGVKSGSRAGPRKSQDGIWDENVKTDGTTPGPKATDARLSGTMADTTSADSSSARPSLERGNTQQQVNRLGAQFDGVYETAD